MFNNENAVLNLQKNGNAFNTFDGTSLPLGLDVTFIFLGEVPGGIAYAEVETMITDGHHEVLNESQIEVLSFAEIENKLKLL